MDKLIKLLTFGETNISPNIAYIPKLKFDSFVKSKVMDDFSNAIAKLESQMTRISMKNFFDYLDVVYNSLTKSLDDLFNLINSDIKRYSSGLGSMSNVAPEAIKGSQLLGSGFLPMPSIYGHHLGSASTKYLM